MIESGGIEDIDYKALFEQVQRENEGIRMRYLKLKNDELSFIGHMKVKMAGLVKDVRFPIYLNIAMALLVFVVVPIFQALFNLIIRRKPDVE